MFALLTALVGTSATAEIEWVRLPVLPDAHGVAGAFAGVSGGALLVAGGANFPDRKPWEGGTKVWYDVVYVLERADAKGWRVGGRLPRPLGYGVSVTHRDSVVCVGGSDGGRHYGDAFRLTWRDGRVEMTPLPAVPSPVANGCGAVVGDTLYVAGGQARPDSAEASAAVYAIDLAAVKPEWRTVAPLPGGGRILAVAAAMDKTFWVVGGAELVKGADGKPARRYVRDAYRYDVARGWDKVADLPRPAAAAPSPAPVDASGFYVMGGDDGTQVGVAPDQHKGFATNVLRYVPRVREWQEFGRLEAPRVTTPVVYFGDRWVIPSGEVRPGVRSPEVWGWSIPRDARR